MAAGWRGVGIPLPGYDKEHAADPQVGEEDVHPDVRRQGVEEGEHTGVGPVGLAVQNADPQGHEGLGEVDRFLPDMGDGERSDGQVSFLSVTRRERGTKGKKEAIRKPLPSLRSPPSPQLALLRGRSCSWHEEPRWEEPASARLLCFCSKVQRAVQLLWPPQSPPDRSAGWFGLFCLLKDSALPQNPKAPRTPAGAGSEAPAEAILQTCKGFILAAFTWEL